MHPSIAWIVLVATALAANSASAQIPPSAAAPSGLRFPAAHADYIDSSAASAPPIQAPVAAPRWPEQPASFNTSVPVAGSNRDSRSNADAPAANRSPQAAAPIEPARPDSSVDAKQAAALPRVGEAKPLPKPGGVTHGREINGLPSIWTTFGSLFAVIGIFCGGMWMLRRGLPNAPRTLPREALEVLGRAPLAGKQHAHLVRVGNKLLLLAISPGDIKTLTEITDPVEVDRLAGICVQSSSTSATAAFKQVFQQFAGDRKTQGFLGDSHRNTADIAARVDEALATEDHDV